MDLQVLAGDPDVREHNTTLDGPYYAVFCVLCAVCCVLCAVRCVVCCLRRPCCLEQTMYTNSVLGNALFFNPFYPFHPLSGTSHCGGNTARDAWVGVSTKVGATNQGDD